MSTSLLEKSRFNMIMQQIRPAGILDDRVLDALSTLPRDAFVADKYKNIAYSDVEVPIEVDGIPTNETMLVPRMEARLAEESHLQATDTVLEIGTGSGFQAALLSRLCTQVVSVEINPKIASFAKSNLTNNHISNVAVEIGDAQNGWGGSVEYNAIIVTGALPAIPDSLKYQLAEGGRLVAVVGTENPMRLVRITRLSASNFKEEFILETYIKPLQGPVVSQFSF